MKNVLKVSKITANSIIYGETGRGKISNIIYERMLNYWLKLKQGNSSKLSVIMFRLMKTMHDGDIFKCKWSVKVRDLLNNLGLTFIWDIDVTDLSKNLG